MTFHRQKLRVKELAVALNCGIDEIISSCVILEIPASSPISSLTIEDCQKIIKFMNK